MSVFDLSDELESINGGASRYDMAQIYPITGAIQDGTVIGTSGAAGLCTFQFQDSLWWSPCQSYFHMRLTFTEGGTAGINNKPVAYADNFIMTLFTQLQTYINSKPLDTVNTPWLIDTCLQYSNSRANFLKTWGSLTRVGESLTTRIRNISRANNGTGQIEVVFRPPVSLFDTKLLPPGAQFRLDFNFASNGINAFETAGPSLTWGATGTNVQIKINSFSFYKATITPGPGIQLPQHGVIDLFPAIANQYFCNNSTTLKQNITLPGSTNLVRVVFQDISATTVTDDPPASEWCGVGNGYNPATSFSNIFCMAGSTTNASITNNTYYLQQLWLSLPELGIQEPNPIYSFDSVMDKMRAYSDFCHYTQGTKDQLEGSIPYGSDNYLGGVTIVALNTGATAGDLAQLGDPNNPQQYWYLKTSASDAAPNTASYNQTSRWGWVGRCPGPIFCFPVVRPEGKTVSTGTLNVLLGPNGTASGGAMSIAATVIASYSMAIVVELQPTGYYSYSLVEGI